MHALACLAAALLVSAPVEVPLGGEPLPLSISVEVRTAGGVTSTPPLSWRTRADGAIDGTASGPGFR
ncbi:MAG TPA: hypothetical protein VFK90_10840, partial [Anaeromyxobacter sp.]|nr:hypothetical protein [Anaeromyxobacter sp.]